MFPPKSNAPTGRTFDTRKTRETLRQLLRPGFIGVYDHIEVVEVVATPRGGRTLNIFSIAVLGEGVTNLGTTGQPDVQPIKPKRIDGFKDWRFGVARFLRPVSALDETLDQLSATGSWTLSGKPLAVGPLEPQPPAFAPPDGTEIIPVNSLLKNNFWAGSHVLRLLDVEKTLFKPFFEDRRRLQALSDAVAPFAPIAFAGLADFLGDVVIQLPVTVLVPAMRSERGADDVLTSVAWRSGCPPRPLRAAARTRWDGLVTDADVSEPFETSARLAVNGDRQPVESEIWDVSTKILVGATASTSTLKEIDVDIHAIRHEPRLFTILDETATPKSTRITLISTSRVSVGDSATNDVVHWRGRRQHLEEARLLADTREFVQYRPMASTRDERRRALQDIRFLIDKHGGGGADVWDPYLTADDLLQTLFWCQHAGVRLRGLTDGRDPPSSAGTIGPTLAFPDRQRAVLAQRAGNMEGLRLEYRTCQGPEGWEFHDRFLIFPGGREGPSAWSLGTSVNSVGTAHHILQRVSNAALVAGAFEDLWNALNKPTHLIWRSW